MTNLFVTQSKMASLRSLQFASQIVTTKVVITVLAVLLLIPFASKTFAQEENPPPPQEEFFEGGGRKCFGGERKLSKIRNFGYQGFT